MPFAAALSKARRLDDALASVCDRVLSDLDGVRPDLSLVFVSHAHAEHFDDVARQISERIATRVLLGCSGETVIGGREEVEGAPALSLWAAALPGARVEPFEVEFAQTPDGIVCDGLPAVAGTESDVRAVLLLGEPFSSAPQSVIDHFAVELPGTPILGGMASGGRRPGTNRLFFGAQCVRRGAVGALLRGGPLVRTIVSQGCRPVGTPFVVTRADENVLLEIGGLPPLARLQEMVPTLSERDQSLVRQGLHVGLVMNEYKERFERGDFLISNVLGADAQTGAIAIANAVRVGQTIQFHVRDAETADEDLVQLLEFDRRANPPPQAALLFSCNGRGTRLFPEPHHDVTTIERLLGPLPLAGFFAQGELGPVGGTNYIHGYTASVALFE